MQAFASAFRTTLVGRVCQGEVGAAGRISACWLEGLARARAVATPPRRGASPNVSLHASMLRCNIVGNREQMFHSVGLMFSFVELFLVKVSFMIVAFCTTQLQESEQMLEV